MRVSGRCFKAVLAGAGLLAVMQTTAFGDKVWIGGAGDWFAGANWGGGVCPGPGDAVVIATPGSAVTLTNSAPELSSLVLGGATLTFSNAWDAVLEATNLTIQANGKITCAGPFTNNGVRSRVNLKSKRLVVEANGVIDVKGRGYSGGISGTWSRGHGPGAGIFDDRCGGGYGGSGSGNDTEHIYRSYGSVAAPEDPGSGGGAGWTPNVGGHGGGAVRIVAASAVVNGAINADGGNGPTTWCSGGSGGGVFITCITLAGTNGSITVNGGTGHTTGGGGGGGRIAVIYDPEAQQGLPVPTITFSAAGGLSGTEVGDCGDIGTLYFPDSRFFSTANLFNGQWMAPGLTNLTLSDWTVNGVWTRLQGQGFTLTVSNTLTVKGTSALRHKLELTNGATLQCGAVTVDNAALGVGTTLNCAGNLSLTNAARLAIYSGLSHPAGPGFGALLDVGGDISVPGNCWIQPTAHPTNGTVPLMQMRNLTILTGGGIDADKRGWAGASFQESTLAYGDGKPGTGGGAGHGGRGGGGPSYTNAGGYAYGDARTPVKPGSGAYYGYNGAVIGKEPGGTGGGSVQIRASGIVNLQGRITANGNDVKGHYYYGAGSGGRSTSCAAGLSAARWPVSRRKAAAWSLLDMVAGAPADGSPSGAYPIRPRKSCLSVLPAVYPSGIKRGQMARLARCSGAGCLRRRL